jgi:hypothetical protein
MAHIRMDAVACWEFTSRRISTVPGFKGVFLGPKLVWERILFCGHRRTPVNIQHRGKSALPTSVEITHVESSPQCIDHLRPHPCPICLLAALVVLFWSESASNLNTVNSSDLRVRQTQTQVGKTRGCALSCDTARGRLNEGRGYRPQSIGRTNERMLKMVVGLRWWLVCDGGWSTMVSISSSTFRWVSTTNSVSIPD